MWTLRKDGLKWVPPKIPNLILSRLCRIKNGFSSVSGIPCFLNRILVAVWAGSVAVLSCRRLFWWIVVVVRYESQSFERDSGGRSNVPASFLLYINKRIISLISKGKIYPLVRVPLWSPSENVRVWPCSYSRQTPQKFTLLPNCEQGERVLRESSKSALIWSLKFPLVADFKLNGSRKPSYTPRYCYRAT